MPIPKRPARWALVFLATALLALPGRASAEGFLVSARFSNNVLLYDANTGAFERVFAQGNGLINAIGMDFGPDGSLYVASGDNPQVFRFDGETGEFIDRFVENDPNTPEDETANLVRPRGLVFGPDNHLYVSSGGSNRVNAYDGTTGEFLRIAATGGGLAGPIGVAFGLDGNLYVAGGTSGKVHRYDGTTGAAIDAFANLPTSNATGLVFGPNGNLYVGSGLLRAVYEYDGSTGAFVKVAARGSGLQSVIGLAFDTNGLLYVSSLETDNVLRFDGAGAFVDQFIPTGSGGLNGPHFFLFTQDPVPAPQSTFGAVKAKFGQP